MPRSASSGDVWDGADDGGERVARIPADERRQQLVEAAIRVMARDSVAQATTRAIVGEAGMPLGVFHYCFR